MVPWPLVCDATPAVPRWRPDLDGLARLVTPRTRMILICNPNNPTGARLTCDEVDGICRIARASAGPGGCSDEIYRGAEIDGVETPTVWGRYDRAIVTSGLSKAYGLPGLRIGWVVSTPELVEQLWGVHDYTTIAPGAVNDCLARIALAPGRRERLLARTRGIIRTNYPVLRKWIERHGDWLSHVAAGRRCDRLRPLRARDQLDRLIERLRDEKGVLVVPGDHFDMDGYLRIGFGSEHAHLIASLTRSTSCSRRSRHSPPMRIDSRARSDSATSDAGSRACWANSARSSATSSTSTAASSASRRAGTVRHSAPGESTDVAAASLLESGAPAGADLHDATAAAAPAHALDVIGLAARSDAAAASSSRRRRSTSGTAAPPSITSSGAGRGLPRRDGEQGAGRLRLRRLRARADAAGLSFLFEGAVMDGVPVFNFVRETLPAVRVLGFRGVINSTTNHILTALENGRGVRAGARTHAGARHRRGRPVARRRRLGRRGKGGGARQRADGRRHHAA